MATWVIAVLLCAMHQAHARQLPGTLSGRVLACVDTYPACPGWAGQCATPGVATYCPCMCGVAPPTSFPVTASPSPVPPSPLPSSPVASPLPPSPVSSPSSGCVDTYPACPGWVGQCATPGVATYCPCMCGVAPTTSSPVPPPTASPTPSPAPSPALSPAPSPSPAPAPSPSPAPAPAPALGAFVFSPYKDVTVNMNWNTNVMSTAVTGSLQPVLSVLPAKDQALTWAFATGECGAESWAGIAPAALASANVQNFVNAGKKYIISTGGAAGVFTCGTDAGFTKFLNTYLSTSMIGVDFDIEGGQSQADINNLVQRIAVARASYPSLRWSFTLATLGSTSTNTNQLNQLGTWVLQALKAANVGWNNIYINLMVMDYGSASSSVCTVVNGQCDMAQSALNAAKALNTYWGVPYSSIELTPMIGGNDSSGETFTLANTDTVSSFVKANGLGGVHFWSLDRDHDCAPGAASATCNTYGVAGTLGFTNRFITDLGM